MIELIKKSLFKVIPFLFFISIRIAQLLKVTLTKISLVCSFPIIERLWPSASLFSWLFLVCRQVVNFSVLFLVSLLFLLKRYCSSQSHSIVGNHLSKHPITSTSDGVFSLGLALWSDPTRQVFPLLPSLSGAGWFCGGKCGLSTSFWPNFNLCPLKVYPSLSTRYMPNREELKENTTMNSYQKYLSQV